MTCAHHWTVTSECPRCLREQLDALAARLAEEQKAHERWYDEWHKSQARLAEAEALLKEARPVTKQAGAHGRSWMDWLTNIDAFLASDSASDDPWCCDFFRAIGQHSLDCIKARAADQPSAAESKMFQGADGNWYTETIITFGAHR